MACSHLATMFFCLPPAGHGSLRNTRIHRVTLIGGYARCWSSVGEEKGAFWLQHKEESCPFGLLGALSSARNTVKLERLPEYLKDTVDWFMGWVLIDFISKLIFYWGILPHKLPLNMSIGQMGRSEMVPVRRTAWVRIFHYLTVSPKKRRKQTVQNEAIQSFSLMIFSHFHIARHLTVPIPFSSWFPTTGDDTVHQIPVVINNVQLSH